jgi:hypothetical protein
MTLSDRALIDLPIGALKVLDDAGRDLVLLVLGQRAAHAADEAEPPITMLSPSSSAFVHMAEDENEKRT